MSIRVVASVLIAAAGVGLGAPTDSPPPAAEPDLEGLGPVRPLAGRSPSYTVRQLFDFRQVTGRAPGRRSCRRRWSD